MTRTNRAFLERRPVQEVDAIVQQVEAIVQQVDAIMARMYVHNT